ncbi:unnamed protein product [Closterium sp. NIES-54]
MWHVQERGTGPACGSAAMEEALQKAQADLAAAQKAVEEERQAGEEAVAQCAQLEAQCRDLEEQVQQAQSKLKEAKEAAQENGAQDSAMLAMLNLPESDARVQLMEALASLEQEKRKSNSFCMQQIELRIKAKKLQDELRASDVPALKQEVASLQDELAQAKALLDKAEEEKEELLAQLQEAEAVGNSAMQAEVEHVRGENNMLMQQLDMLALQFDQEKNLIHAHMAQKEEEVQDMKLRLADERQEREEAQRRLEESERRREAVKGEMEAMEQQAFKMRQSLVHMQRQITEAEHSPGRLYVEALEEQRSKVAQLEQQVAEKGHAEQELQQLQAAMAAAEAQMKERETQLSSELASSRAAKESLQKQLEEIRSHHLTWERDRCTLLEALNKVGVRDPRKPTHVLRLRQKGSYTCAQCLALGRGLAWKCTARDCTDLMHPDCLLHRPQGKHAGQPTHEAAEGWGCPGGTAAAAHGHQRHELIRHGLHPDRLHHPRRLHHPIPTAVAPSTWSRRRANLLSTKEVDSSSSSN